MFKATRFTRNVSGIIVAVLALSFCAPVLLHTKAFAYGEVTDRGIEMSSAAAGASSVTYQAQFTTATQNYLEGVVIDFCDNDPIIGDTCGYTSGQSINITSVALSTITCTNNGGCPDTTVGTGHWTVANETDGTASDGALLTLENTSAAETATKVNAGVTVTITLSGFTNPQYSSGNCSTDPNCTFYARMLTYDNTTNLLATGGTPYNSTAPNASSNLVDAGGAALSTAAVISLTSKVQEELSFCVYVNPAGSSDTCTTGSTPNVLLGNNNDVLSTQGAFIDKTTQFDIQTNASQGVNVNMQGNTLTTGGSITIAPMSTVPVPTSANDLPVAGSSQFGLCDYSLTGSNLSWPNTGSGSDAVFYNGSDTDASADGGTSRTCGAVSQSSGTSSVATAPSTYVDFYFNSNTATNTPTSGAGPGIPSTYGDTIVQDAAGPSNTGVIAFMADIAVTQAAGVYSTNLGLIANGTY